MKYITFVFIFLITFSNIQAQKKESPVTIEAKYIGDFFSNLSGGIKTGQGYLGLLSFGLGITTDDLGLWKGGRFYSSIQNTHGATPSQDYIGDQQVASNIDGGEHTHLYEFCYNQHFNKIGIKVGLLDLNTNYHISSVGGLYLNSSFGVMPTVSLNMPTPIFPSPTLGLQLNYQLNQRIAILAGIWDGNSGKTEENRYNINWELSEEEGFLYVTEIEYNYSDTQEQNGKIKFGSVYHSGKFPTINDTTQNTSGNLQFHAIADHTLISKPEGVKGRLDAFVQLGYSPNKIINHTPIYLGFGFNYSGILFKDASDVLGLAVAHAGLNNLEIFNRPMHETAIELTYAFNLVNNIRVQPDLQYCINPGQAIQLNNALTAFLRIVISH